MTMQDSKAGIVRKDGYTDYLYRVALRALIRNENGDILIVKEKTHDWWDLPGGGLDYGESIEDGLKRELQEEIGLNGDFKYKVIALEEPSWNERLGAMQLNAIFEVIPHTIDFSLGIDGVEMKFMPLKEIYDTNLPDSKIVMSLRTIL